MTPGQSLQAVKDRATAIAYTMDGEEVGRGRVIAYSMVPTVTIETESGERLEWRHDLCGVLPTTKPSNEEA